MRNILLIAVAALFAACQPPTVAKNGGLVITLGVVEENPTNQDVKTTEQILKNRMNAICANNPTVTYDAKGHCFRLEFPRETDRLKFDTLLFSQGRFETLEVYELSELHDCLHQANRVYAERQSAIPTDSMLAANPLFSVLMLRYVEGRPQQGPVLGYSKVGDTAKVNGILRTEYIKALFPSDVKFMWAKEENSLMSLISIRGINQSAGIDNSALEKVEANKSSWGYEVQLTFKPEFHQVWARMTANNVGRSLALVIDGQVYSYPRVNSEITGGRSTISANFDESQANILAAVLNYGILPVGLKFLNVERVEAN